MEYAPQYRSVNVQRRVGDPPFSLSDNLTHFWTLGARLKGSSIFGVDIDQAFTKGSLEGYELDPNVAELIRNNKEGFWHHDLGINFKWDGSKQGAQISVGKEDSAFDSRVTAPAWFELNSWRMGTQYHYRFAPLSSFLLGYNYTHNDQDFTVKAIQNGLPDSVGSVQHEVYFGFKGELGRTTTGSANVGFKALNYDSIAGNNADWQGFTARADVTKSFSRWTKLIFNAERTPNLAAWSGSSTLDDSNTYYISNRASFTLANQPQGSRVGWTVIGQFQRNGWDNAAAGDPKRSDDLVRLRGEIGFHPLEHLSFRLNFEHKDSDSNINAYDFVDNLVIFQVQFGF